MTRGSIFRGPNPLASGAGVGVRLGRSLGRMLIELIFVALAFTGAAAALGLNGVEMDAALPNSTNAVRCCGDCNDDGAVGVSELVSLVRDALGLETEAECEFGRIGNCGQFPGQAVASMANFQTAIVRSLRGCEGCPLYFGKGDFGSGCAFRGHIELTDGRKLPAEMRVNEVSIFLVLTEAEGGLTVLFNDVVLFGAPTPTPRVRPGRDLVGEFRIGPEDVLQFSNGRLEIGDDGTTMTLALETPRFGVRRIAATYDRKCVWATIGRGGCQ